MSGLELLLIPAVAPVFAPVYAWVRGRNQPDDPEEVERARVAAAEAEAKDAARTKALLQALRASDEGHRALIEAWRGPFSLFDKVTQAEAREKGVPAWAIEYVCEGKKIADESSELSDLADVYEAQIAAAERDEKRDVTWEPVVVVTSRLISLRKKMYVHLPRLKAARAAFDAPSDAPAEPPCIEAEPEPPIPKRSKSDLCAADDSSPKLKRSFSVGSGRPKFFQCESMQVDEDGSLAEATNDECWAVVDFKFSDGGEFKWSFEVVDDAYTGNGGGAFYGLCSGDGNDREYVYLHGHSGTCYKSRSNRSWDKTSAVTAGSVIQFHLDLSTGVLLGSVDEEKPVELVRDTTIFAGKDWRPCVGAQGARPVVRLLTCAFHASPVVIIRPASTPGLAEQTAAFTHQMWKGVDRQRREKPMMKAVRDYAAWQGLNRWG